MNLGLEGPALIVAGKSAIALLSGAWESSLHTAGLMHSILRFGRECSLSEIEKGKAAARKSDARIIIGAGGGMGAGDGLWRHRDGKAFEIWKGADGALMETPTVSPDGSRVDLR